MKIALIHYTTAPVIGGVERIVAAHARIFAEHGHDVLVISQRGKAGVQLDRGGSAVEYFVRLEAVLRECDVAIVHNVMTMPFDLALTEALARLAQELRQTRFIAWAHDLAAINPDLAPSSELIARAAEGFSHVAVSELRARQFTELTGIVPRLVPNGIDPAEVLALPEVVARVAEELGLFDAGTVLLHPTRLLRRKNVEFGLQVMTHLRETGTTLLITGAEDLHHAPSREYAAWLQSERNRLALEERVVFLREHFPIGDDEMSAFYRVADALFLPSKQEGFGLPVLEAAMHRLPMFVSDIAAFDELANLHARRFSLKGPPADAARLIGHTLENDLASRARKAALEYRWSRIYALHLEPLLSGN